MTPLPLIRLACSRAVLLVIVGLCLLDALNAVRGVVPLSPLVVAEDVLLPALWLLIRRGTRSWL